MHSFNKPSNITITCSKRLTPYLEQEITALGFKIKQVFPTAILLAGSLNDCIILNLNLRTASQVLYSLKKFKCDHPRTLYNEMRNIQWESVIPTDGYFSVTGNVRTDTVNNALFANVTVKDAIADRFREKVQRRPDSGPAVDKTVIHLFWKDEEAEIFIDTSGETLSKHGYRKIPGKAPMLESLAAAAILATNWDRQSPFVNPMCGSSTLAIEAALIATNRSPGLYRDNYAFMHIAGYSAEFYNQEKLKLNDQIKQLPGLKIIATDISEDAINISKINAGVAGVADLLSFEVCDFAETPVPGDEAGVVFFNPEYGDRLGDEIQLEDTYARMGDFMKKKCKGYTGYIFTGNLNLAKKIGLKAKRKIEFYNGKIDCRLLVYDLYAGSKQ